MCCDRRWQAMHQTGSHDVIASRLSWDRIYTALALRRLKLSNHTRLALNLSLSDEEPGILLTRSSNNAFAFWQYHCITFVTPFAESTALISSFIFRMVQIVDEAQPHRHLIHASIIFFLTLTVIISFLSLCFATFFMVAVMNSHYTLQK